MKRNLLTVTAGVLGALVLTTAAAGASSITNGSFESGLGGWTGAPGTNVNVLTGGAPGAGSSYGSLTAGQNGVYTTLSQTFTASAGVTLSGQANFATINGGGDPCGALNDDGEVVILQGSTVVATVYARTACSVISGAQSGDWASWSYVVPADGIYTLQAQVENRGDSDALFASFLGLDAVTIVDAPTANVPTSKSDCQRGGWQTHTRPDGSPFKNTGDCLGFLSGR